VQRLFVGGSAHLLAEFLVREFLGDGGLSVTPGMRPCGIATPCPRPVLPSFSRAVRPLKMSVVDSDPAPLASRRLSSSSDFFLLVTVTPDATRSAVSMALSFIVSP